MAETTMDEMVLWTKRPVPNGYTTAVASGAGTGNA